HSTNSLELGCTTALPQSFATVVNGLRLNLDKCACTQAATTGKRVVVESIADQLELDPTSILAQAAGFRACWCEPILSPTKKILGTLSIFHSRPSAPSEVELCVLGHAAQMAGIAIERTTANERIRASEERLRMVMQATQDAIWDYDVIAGTVWWNDTYRERYGRPPEADSADWWISRIHPDDRERLTQSLAAFAAGQGTSERWTDEYRYQRAGGGFAYVLDRAQRSRDASGRVVRIVGALYDRTERRELEKQVLDIATHERRRIGNDLHDGLGQELTGLSMVADSLITALSRKSLPETQIAEKLSAGLQRTLSQVRALARGLNPVAIDVRGLQSALEEMATRVKDDYQVECVFLCEQEVLFRENKTATQLFRIAQEATTNALRHGQARHIAIDLAMHDDCAELRIADDGSGFQSDGPTGLGTGLQIMRYRAGLIGGQLHINSTPSGGTQVVCRVPM
ncbi:MAG: PAS domain-containing protein, partial [Aureliella sp.]